MKISDRNREILNGQIEYYRARSSEYDEWFLRQGRYDRGEEHRRLWTAELHKAQTALEKAQPHGRILEIACGTGLWTPVLARAADELTAIDSSSESIAINREKTGDAKVKYITADIFTWQHECKYDFIFFGFWLSHVPQELFDEFWCKIASILKPDGKVFFIDSLFETQSTAIDHNIDHSGIAERILNDGSKYTIVKIFHEPSKLEKRIKTLGFSGSVHTTGRFFLWGEFGRKESIVARNPCDPGF